MSHKLPRSRTEMELAESAHIEKLEREKKLDRKEGMADAYGNLGSIYLALGHLDKAEEMEAIAYLKEAAAGLEYYLPTFTEQVNKMAGES